MCFVRASPRQRLSVPDRCSHDPVRAQACCWWLRQEGGPRITETTALGAAYLAGLAVGYWPSIESIQQQWQLDAEFKPKAGKDEVNDKINGWHEAVKRDLTGTHPTPNS